MRAAATHRLQKPRVRLACTPNARLICVLASRRPNFKETQVEAFEKGTDYIFFQGPKPATGYQPDLPSFFSLDNFADLEISPAQIAVTVTGLGTAGIVALTLLEVPLPGLTA